MNDELPGDLAPPKAYQNDRSDPFDIPPMLDRRVKRERTAQPSYLDLVGA
jgi:hypothetical protein